MLLLHEDRVTLCLSRSLLCQGNLPCPPRPRFQGQRAGASRRHHLLPRTTGPRSLQGLPAYLRQVLHQMPTTQWEEALNRVRRLRQLEALLGHPVRKHERFSHGGIIILDPQTEKGCSSSGYALQRSAFPVSLAHC